MFKELSIPVFFLAAALFAYCLVKTVQTYLKKRKKVAITLIFLFAADVFSNIYSALSGLLYGVLYSTQFGNAFSLLANAVAIIGILYFATAVFSIEEERKSMKLGRLFYSIIFIAIYIWGTIGLLFAAGGETTLPLAFLLILSLALLIILAVLAYRLATKVAEEEFKTSIVYIGHFALCGAGIYVLFVLDNLVGGQEGTTVWGFIGACVFAFAAYLAYVGFVKQMNAR